jgi:hypothetical protein
MRGGRNRDSVILCPRELLTRPRSGLGLAGDRGDPSPSRRWPNSADSASLIPREGGQPPELGPTRACATRQPATRDTTPNSSLATQPFLGSTKPPTAGFRSSDPPILRFSGLADGWLLVAPRIRPDTTFTTLLFRLNSNSATNFTAAILLRSIIYSTRCAQFVSSFSSAPNLHGNLTYGNRNFYHCANYSNYHPT